MPVVALAQRENPFNRKFDNKSNLNLPNYDRKLIHFGFILGLNYFDFVVKNVADLDALDSVYVVKPIGAPGFNLGIVSDLRLGQHFNFRFIPGISFVGRTMEYTLMVRDTVPKTVTRPTESVFLELPLYFRFRSRRINNYRVFITAGGKVMYDMASKEDVNENGETILKLKREDFTYDMGVGIDWYLQYFKLTMEVKVAYGVNNLIVKDGTPFAESIDFLGSKSVLVSFYFE